MNLRPALFAIPILSFLAIAACANQDDPTASQLPTDGEDGGGGGKTDGGPTDPDATTPYTSPCKVTKPGKADSPRLFKGTLLLPTEAVEGELLIDAAGNIACAAKSCSSADGYDDAAVVTCTDAVISPGLINPHDHISFANNPPHAPMTERYEHRHDWRKGARSHTAIKTSAPKVDNSTEAAELRFAMTGTTSTAGAGGTNGLIRNVDGSAAQMEGLKMMAADSDTFPLKDSDLKTFPTTCAAFPAGRRTAASMANLKGYLPHISEGIDDSAHAEFTCQSDEVNDPTHDIVATQTAVVHGVGVLAADVQKYHADQATLVWSPRSNIDLYGNTAPVVLYENLGVQIALGTDWLPSGSMNMARELHCADDLNQKYFGKKFTDKQLWQMVTVNAAYAIGAQNVVGALKKGYAADIAIFDGRGKKNPYRAVIEAGAEDTVLVLRGGQALYGDAALAGDEGAGGGADCEDIDVCTVKKKACVKRDLGNKTLADIQAAASKVYPLFFCKSATPTNEPSCAPMRGATASAPNASKYDGIKSGDKDGDGVEDGEDNCPTVFNPIRPMDGNAQADSDSDGIGDACDKCPLEDGESCTPPSSEDFDGDGVLNDVDNCPDTANPDQLDADKDGKGAACDLQSNGSSCDDTPNPDSACPSTFTIVQLRNPAAPGHPAVGARAMIKNVYVTGVKSEGSGTYGFFIQEAAAQWSGIFVATPGKKPTVVVGNKVNVEGDYNELFTNTWQQLENVTYTVDPAAPALPFGPIVVDAATYASNTGGEPWEGLLCEIPGPLTISVQNPDAPSDFDEFAVVQGVNLRVDDTLYDALDNNLPTGTSYQKIVGICAYSFNNRKVYPRNAADLPQ